MHEALQIAQALLVTFTQVMDSSSRRTWLNASGYGSITS